MAGSGGGLCRFCRLIHHQLDVGVAAQGFGIGTGLVRFNEFFLNERSAAKHQNDNNDPENEAERSAANPDGTGKNRR
jgi:hypothetical protein